MLLQALEFWLFCYFCSACPARACMRVILGNGLSLRNCPFQVYIISLDSLLLQSLVQHQPGWLTSQCLANTTIVEKLKIIMHVAQYIVLGCFPLNSSMCIIHSVVTAAYTGYEISRSISVQCVEWWKLFFSLSSLTHEMDTLLVIRFPESLL